MRCEERRNDHSILALICYHKVGMRVNGKDCDVNPSDLRMGWENGFSLPPHEHKLSWKKAREFCSVKAGNEQEKGEEGRKYLATLNDRCNRHPLGMLDEGESSGGRGKGKSSVNAEGICDWGGKTGILPYQGEEYGGFARKFLDRFAASRDYTFRYKILPVARLFHEFLQEKGELDFKFPDNPY